MATNLAPEPAYPRPSFSLAKFRTDFTAMAAMVVDSFKAKSRAQR